MRIEFLITSLIVVVTPGIGVLFTLSAAITRGSPAAVVASIGCTLGIVPHALAAIVGLAAVLQTSAVAFLTLKYLGVGYLLYLAYKTLREHGGLTVDQAHERSFWEIIRSAIFVNLLNPKLSLFFFAFLPQFIDPRDPHPIAAMTLLSAVFMLVDFRRVRRLRPAGGTGPRQDPVATQCARVVPPVVRARVRWTRRQAGAS